MMNVHIICVGKLKETFYTQAAAEYQKRLSPFCKLQLTELPEEKLPQDPSQAQIDAALKKEAAVIRSKLPPNAAVVALCIEGKLHSSEALAGLLRTWENNPAKHLVFLIDPFIGNNHKSQLDLMFSGKPGHFFQINSVLLCRYLLFQICPHLRQRIIPGDRIGRLIAFIPVPSDIIYPFLKISPPQFFITVMCQRIRQQAG